VKNLFFLAIIALFATLSLANEPDARVAYEKAQEYERSGDTQNALLWYKKSAQLSFEKTTLTKKDITNVEEPLIRFGKNSIDSYENNVTNATIEKIIFANFDIKPYKTNYLLPYTYDFISKSDRKSMETKFQISFKKQLGQNIFGLNEKFYLGYTQVSWWQTSASSAPFRETNYLPEIFVQFPYPSEKTALKAYTIGLIHESNGRNSENSRSWNRIYLEGIFQYKGFFITPRAWYRIPENTKTSINDTNGDDNPDIEDYLGYGDLKIVYPYKENLFSILIRNNLRFNDSNKGTYEFNWTFPIPWISDMYGYLQYFNGYGESLIDYDRKVEKVGLGFAITR
jgi:phospholipase A1